MPRKSAAAQEVAVIKKARSLRASGYAKPPGFIGDREAEEWRAIVSAHPAEWFDASNLPLLEAYVRHIILHRDIAALLEKTQAEMIRAAEAGEPDGLLVTAADLEIIGRLTNMLRRETNAMASLAVKMRLAQSSRYNADKRPSRGGGGAGRRPWETE